MKLMGLHLNLDSYYIRLAVIPLSGKVSSILRQSGYDKGPRKSYHCSNSCLHRCFHHTVDLVENLEREQLLSDPLASSSFVRRQTWQCEAQQLVLLLEDNKKAEQKVPACNVSDQRGYQI